jgi:hypothetical protein
VTGLTLLGAPAGCPIDFFSLILDAFSDADISAMVFGVSFEILFLGRQ